MTPAQTPLVDAAGTLTILAPVSGVLVPLDTVPDPVFAGKLVGDGISIDPTSTEVLAPVAGTVTQLHGAHHALAITTTAGIEVMVHIGLDTVKLKGEGFVCKTKIGDKVQAGQGLLSFDPVLIGRKAASLLTQIVITNGEKVTAMTRASGLVRAGKDPILTLRLAGAEAPAATATSTTNAATPAAKATPTTNAATPAAAGTGAVLSDPVPLPNRFGLHARPAATLAAAAKQFTSEIKLVRGKDEVNARSVLAIMGLGARPGDPLQIKATGADAKAAVDALAHLLAEGCGEEPPTAAELAEAETPDATAQASAAAVDPAGQKAFAGIACSPGLAVGQICQFRQEAIEVATQGEAPDRERSRLKSALHDARQQIEAIKSRMTDPSKAKILSADQEILDDPELGGLAQDAIQAGKSAGFAWREACAAFAARLESLDNALLNERAADVRGVGRRVLQILAGPGKPQTDFPANSILVAEELSAADTAKLDRSKVLGLCTIMGGATSHVAILARSLGIPAICGIDRHALELPDGTRVVLDGAAGTLRRDPSDEELAKTQELITQMAAKRAREQAGAHKPALTRDGARIEVAANISSAADAREAVEAGADGVGLLRSEFLFTNRATAPTEAEQAAEYLATAEALGRGRKLVVRTLDVGGDKPLAYLPLPSEANPMLGLRGIRVSLDRPALFRIQLRAILAAAPKGDLHIMFPMIASLDELRAAKRVVREEAEACGSTAKVGLMVEVPAAALIADQLASEADFLSIGTNDLTQYCLAMDRGDPTFANQADGLHPAVLKLIALTVEGAHKHGRWVGVCGGIASDPLAVAVLIGLGVDELSVTIPAIAGIKAQIGRLDRGHCAILAREILSLGTAADVRARLASFIG
jgi:phosphocarrier protein FPr/phosphocarrier protein